jgi:hypothetical protein
MEPRQQPEVPGSPPAAVPSGPPPAVVPGQWAGPGAGPVRPVVAGPRRRGGWLRAVLAVLGGMVALLCLGGVGLAFVLYNEETKPDRSAPDVVVDNFLRALFIDRNEATADMYACKTDAGLQTIYDWKTDVETQERRLDTTITVSWGELAVETQGTEQVAVTTDISRTAHVDGSTQNLLDRWRFEVVDENGWRVCGAERVS